MKAFKKYFILVAIILLSQNLFADIFDRIAALTNAVNDIRATTNTCEKITPFNLLKSCGISECLLERADMTERGTLPPPRWPWVLDGFTSSTGMVDQAEEYIDILQTDRDPLPGKFAEPGGTVIDHCLIEKDGETHLFYIRGKACTSWPEWPCRNFGHAISTNLIDWDVKDPVLQSPETGWDNYQVWAPHIIEHNGVYWMFYTGVSSNPVTQAIGLATSSNLYDWTRVGNGPILEPGPWAKWSQSIDCSCRDPMVLKDGDTYYCYFTAQKTDNDYCVGVSSSTDLTNWTDEGFIDLASSVATPPESPFVVKRSPTNYYLIYTSYSHGIVYAISTNKLTGWADATSPDFVIAGGSASEHYLDGTDWKMSFISHEQNHLHFFEIRDFFWHDDGTVSAKKFPTSLTGKSGLLFKDSYDNISGSGNVNLDVTNSARQTGKLSPIAYKSSGETEVGDASVNPGKLAVAPGTWVYPFYNFTDSGNFVIEFDLLSQMGLGTNAWITFSFGSPSAPSWPHASQGFGMFFFGHGYIQSFANAGILSSIAYDLSATRHITISVASDGFTGTNDALITVFVNGKPIVLHDTARGGKNNYTYLLTNGFSDNYMTFATLGGGAPYYPTNSLVDNFTVRTVEHDPYSEFAWSTDPDTMLSTTKTYTHKIKLDAHDGNISVNGVTFDGVSALSGSDWEFNSVDGVYNLGANIGVNNVQPEGSKLLEYMSLVNGGNSGYIYLTNLVAGAPYKFALYSRGMDTPVTKRNVYMTGSDGAPAKIIDQNHFGNGNGQIDTYYYIAPEDGTFCISLTSFLPGHGWNYHAFSNEEAPIPEPYQFIIYNLLIVIFAPRVMECYRKKCS